MSEAETIVFLRLKIPTQDANEMEFSIHFDGHTVQKEFILEGLNSEIRMLIDDLPRPNMLNLINLNCTNDIF
jgi:hypothetical protein